MNDVAIQALEALLPWSKPREVPTKRGPRILRKAEPNEAFWAAWRAGKPQLQAHGVNVGKSDYGASAGQWEVCWWQEIPQELRVARAASVEASRAADAEINVPCPEGLAYMPFQRGGIQYVLTKTGRTIGHNGKGGATGPSLSNQSTGVLIGDEMGL